MGIKESKLRNLSEQDLKFLKDKTGLTKNEIINFFIEYNKDNPGRRLGRDEFLRIYTNWLKNDSFKKTFIKT